MTKFNLTLQPTYFKMGFFNVTVKYDSYIRRSEGPIRIRLGHDGVIIDGKVNRAANRNGTARIMGGTPLRDWFQRHYRMKDTVVIDLNSPDEITVA